MNFDLKFDSGTGEIAIDGVAVARIISEATTTKLDKMVWLLRELEVGKFSENEEKMDEYRNRCEDYLDEISDLTCENDRLRDEIALLKGRLEC
jgi:predicted RNase H-like nuclease (RuvC/YqgF family)